MKILSEYLLIICLALIISCNRTNNRQNQQSFNKEEMSDSSEVQRYGKVIELKKDKIDEYKKLHADAWPGVLEQLTESNIRNYSIYLHQIGGKYYLFSYFEYTGDNYKKDMEKMAADSVTQEWWEFTDSYQKPLDSRQEGEWWANMKEVFHHD